MNHKDARQLASDMAVWYFQNGLHLQPRAVSLNKQSAAKPRYSDKMWAKLMTEAIISFNEGLDLDPEMRHANKKQLFDAAVDAVGLDAFQEIAFIVSAAGARRPIEEELEQSFEQMQQQPGQSQISSIQDLGNYVTNEMDQYVYSEVSKNKDVNDPNITQSEAHNLTGYLQQVVQTAAGISQPFSQALSSLGAAYQIKADELTRSSGFGNVGPGGETGTSGLPTGVRIGLMRSLARIRHRAAKGNA